jgi:hypothetical protein
MVQVRRLGVEAAAEELLRKHFLLLIFLALFL